MLSLLFLVFVVAGVSSVVIDSVDNTGRSDWIELQRSSPTTPITLWLSIKQENVAFLRNKLIEISTPSNDNYGNWLSNDQLHSILAPNRETLTNVHSWIVDSISDIVLSDIKAITMNSDVVSIKTTISNAESLLNCEYFDYQSTDHPNMVIQRVQMGSDYEVPSNIAPLLDYVSPTVRFPAMQSRLKVTEPSATVVTPTSLRALYNVGSTMAKAKNNTVGISSFVEQYYSQADLTELWTKYNITACSVTNVPTNQLSGHALEAELDTQYMSSMGDPIDMQVWYTDGRFQDAMTKWTTDVLSATSPPLLFSVSYGLPEPQWGASYIDRLNTNFAAIGAKGISILFASGDSGAGGGCTVGVFEPEYPGSSAFVTSVGGVTGGTQGQEPLGEKAWIYGGGGFSNYVGVQSWQKDAVSAYLTTYNADLPEQAKWNASGRGYPDISAQSVDFIIVVNKRDVTVSGTSCASPSAGGVFGLLNDLRLQNGMQSLGFLNPFIYSTAASDPLAFSDSVSGYNEGCGVGVTKGFPAEPKWDAATGYGSPNYAKLATHVMKTGAKTKEFVRD